MGMVRENLCMLPVKGSLFNHIRGFKLFYLPGGRDTGYITRYTSFPRPL